MRLATMVMFCLGCGLGLMGCKGDKGGAATGAYAGGAVDDPQAALVGRWTVDAARLGEVGALEEIPEAQRTLAVEMARNTMNSMAFEFTATEYRVTMAGRTYTRPYTVKGVEGQTVTVEATDDGAPETLTLTFGEGGLVLRAPGERALPLRPR